MFGYLRRRRLPAALRPRLDRDERVVAWASTSDGDRTAGPPWWSRTGACGCRVEPTRLGWHQIHKATWSGSQLTVVPAVQVGTGAGYAVMADDRAVAVGLADPDDVPPQVRNRVNRSVAYTRASRGPAAGACGSSRAGSPASTA